MKWRCTECGKPQPKNSPPCDNCGCWQFEKAVVQHGETEANDSAMSTVEWRCRECGQRHVKNSPPCNRCGHMNLQSTTVTEDEIAMPRTGPLAWASAGRKYLVGIVVVFAIIGLILSGVIDIPGLGPKPTISDVPGHADHASGLNLSLVEHNVHEQVNRERRQRGLDPLSFDTQLKEIAAYHNKNRVKWGYNSTIANEQTVGGLYRQFGYSCPRSPAGNINRIVEHKGTTERVIDQFADESELARVIVDQWLTSEQIAANVFGDWDANGIDVHVGEDGDVFVVQNFC